MAPTLTLLTQTPRHIAKNETLTPAPEVRVAFTASDPDAQRAGEIVFLADLHGGDIEKVQRFSGSRPIVSRLGGRVYMESRFEGVRVREAGRYHLRVSAVLLDGSAGGVVLGSVDTAGFEVY